MYGSSDLGKITSISRLCFVLPLTLGEVRYPVYAVPSIPGQIFMSGDSVSRA